jgi:hypothetical protein
MGRKSLFERVKRAAYINKLKEYGIGVDVYGARGNNTLCKNKSNKQCHIWLSKRYKFYSAFENNLCKDYVTEKFSDSLIVYRGAPNVREFFQEKYIYKYI